jgi:hypothetical protein
MVYLSGIFKMAVQRGRSEVRDAKNISVMSAAAGETVSRQCLGGEAYSFLPARPEHAETGSFPGFVR